MRPTLTIIATKADGAWYRTWRAIIESSDEQCLVTLTTPGNVLVDRRDGWITERYIRTYYWLDKPYNLLEVFDAGGNLLEIFVNIGSLPVVDGDRLTYADYELDVSKEGDAPACIVDEDEFEEAARHYGYSAEFQAFCRAAAQEALAVVVDWTAGPPPIRSNP